MTTPRFCKILATLGPASGSARQIGHLLTAGADAFRLNFSHGKHPEHAKRHAAIRMNEEILGRPIPILADLQGPKLRVGEFAKGGIDLKFGEEVEFRLTDEQGAAGTFIPLPHEELFAAAEAGDVFKLDDGMLQVTVVKPGKDSLIARVDMPGHLSDNKGVNVPSRTLPIPALTEKDIEDLEFALELGVDYIAISFVQSPEDMIAAQKLVKGRAGLIAKIERPSAVENLDAVISECNAIMVARGDLGVELPLEQVPIVQRQIVRAARAQGKPVIVATQMLQSMVDSPTPTRAEASDIAAAVYLGSDAVMLSAESAIGHHPEMAIAIMDRVIRAVEADPLYHAEMKAAAAVSEVGAPGAICRSAAEVAQLIDCEAIIAYTQSGSTGLKAARERPHVPILALSPSIEVARRLNLAWGITGVQITQAIGSFDDLVRQCPELAMSHGFTDTSRPLALIAATPLGEDRLTNVLHVVSRDTA